MNKTYEIFIKYLDGQTETATITTHDIKWTIDQFTRNRNPYKDIIVELQSDEKEIREKGKG